MSELQKSVEFIPAYDKRNLDPKKNYGIHGVSLRFVLKGEKGAVQFVVYTNWQLPHVQAEFDSEPLNQFPYMFHKPMPADLGYHSYIPHYNGQTISRESCEYLDGEPCYYDGSGLNAEPVFDVLLKEGDKGVWRELTKYYTRTFSSES